jgi:hypothetical protein
MTKNKRQQRQLVEGTVGAPNYYEGPAAADFNVKGDVCLHERLYTYRTEAGLVVGWTMSVMFTVEQSAKQVWPHFKDFNRWQKDHYYTGVVGDLEGKTYGISDKPNDPDIPHHRQVLRVVPEYLIVTAALSHEQDAADTGLPGSGGISSGFSVFSLNEHGGKTIATVFMEHGSYASPAQATTAEEALAPWRENNMAPEWQRKWRDDFIPALKKLIYEGIQVK